ncbi:aminotransferase class V-fold PLP-dependent enzyme [Paenibacillus hexagrammi]
MRLSMELMQERLEHAYRIRNRLAAGIARISGVNLTGTSDDKKMAPHIVHVTCPGLKAEVLVHALEKSGIYISTKSACSSNRSEPSSVLLAMGYDRQQAQSGIRISYGFDLTEGEADYFLDHLSLAVKMLVPAAQKSTSRREKRL